MGSEEGRSLIDGEGGEVSLRAIFPPFLESCLSSRSLRSSADYRLFCLVIVGHEKIK